MAASSPQPTLVARRLEFTPPPPSGGRMPTVLALMAHLVLVAALSLSVNWKHQADTPVFEAELWATTPQRAAASPPPPLSPSSPAPTPPPPVPTPTPTPPKPDPKPVKTPAPPPAPPDTTQRDAQIALARDAQIALAKQRDKELLQKRELEIKQEHADKAKKLEELEQLERANKLAKAEKAERAEKAAKAEKAALAAQQTKAEKALKAEQANKAAAAAQAKIDKAEADARHKANVDRMMAAAGGNSNSSNTSSGAANAPPGGNASRSAAPSASYGGRIAARIKPNIVFPGDIPGNPEALVEIKTAPDGTIVGTPRLVKSSGVKAWDDAVVNAILKTEVIPRDTDGRVQPVILLGFKPKDFGQ